MMGAVDPASGLLVERTAELDALDAALAAVGGGSGRLVLVEGATGTGKSALVEAAGRKARSLGLDVLVARGAQLEQAAPFGLAVELFGGDLAADPEHELLVQRLFLTVGTGPSSRPCW